MFFRAFLYTFTWPLLLESLDSFLKPILQISKFNFIFSNLILKTKKKIEPKIDGSIRISVDFKSFNKMIKDDNFPIPFINDLYTKLPDADTFTKIDMKAAYHQTPVYPNSIHRIMFLYIHQQSYFKGLFRWFVHLYKQWEAWDSVWLWHCVDVFDTLNERLLKVSFEKSVTPLSSKSNY